MIQLPEGEALTLDSLYTWDSLILTPKGLVACHKGRVSVGANHYNVALERYGLLPIGEIAPPGTLEGGDLIRLMITPLQSALAAPMMQVSTNFRYWEPLSRSIAFHSHPLAIPRMYSN